AKPHRAVVLTTFGSGNGPTDEAFLDALRDATERGVLLVNATQCVGGSVEQGRYQTSRAFVDMGMLSAHDMTVEAAVTKLMFLLGQGLSDDLVRERFLRPMCGEVSVG
ncbi:MAG TPA: L-asparaginase 1, partial [Flavobacteriales bacterium]|nr:L-asparaginase 1 [Flavobacteriales bacterium]